MNIRHEDTGNTTEFWNENVQQQLAPWNEHSSHSGRGQCHISRPRHSQNLPPFQNCLAESPNSISRKGTYFHSTFSSNSSHCQPYIPSFYMPPERKLGLGRHMAWQVKVLATQTSGPELQLWNIRKNGRRELTPSSCFLLYTFLSLVCKSTLTSHTHPWDWYKEEAKTQKKLPQGWLLRRTMTLVNVKRLRLRTAKTGGDCLLGPLLYSLRQEQCTQWHVVLHKCVLHLWRNTPRLMRHTATISQESRPQSYLFMPLTDSLLFQQDQRQISQPDARLQNKLSLSTRLKCEATRASIMMGQSSARYLSFLVPWSLRQSFCNFYSFACTYA